jgi:predicted RNA binding protein YcfA (HicA-like mRNA interferase family)
MIRALARLGWTVVRVSGSHHILTKSGHPPLTIPVKKGATR